MRHPDSTYAARRPAGVDVPWCVAAGWALDLFRGRQTRAHGDVEIAIPAAAFPDVRNRFPGCVFDGAGSGRIWEDASREPSNAPRTYLPPCCSTTSRRALQPDLAFVRVEPAVTAGEPKRFHDAVADPRATPSGQTGHSTRQPR
jgi:hypothetical protein